VYFGDAANEYSVLIATKSFFMTFQTRRNQSLAILKSTGMWRCNYEPPYLRALWRMGFEVPPPHFVPFSRMVVYAMLWFSSAWGTIMWLLLWSKQGMPGVSAVGISCGTGLFFGLSMATYFAYGRRKYRLPQWVSLDESRTPQ